MKTKYIKSASGLYLDEQWEMPRIEIDLIYNIELLAEEYGIAIGVDFYSSSLQVTGQYFSTAFFKEKNYVTSMLPNKELPKTLEEKHITIEELHEEKKDWDSFIKRVGKLIIGRIDLS